MSENKTKEIESDTDSENEEKNFNNNNQKDNQTNINNNNNNNNNQNNINKMFNQSRQNFEKFAQMAKNNNVDQSYSEKTLSKEEEYLDESQEDNDNYSNKETNNFSNKKNNQSNDKRIKKTQENSRKNPLQTEKDDYNETYSNENNDNNNDLSEEEIENFDRNNYAYANENKETQKLDFFNIDDFYDLDVDPEAKELLNVMKKFSPNRDILILDTKIKPFIPNYVPSIGEVDAFIKINRPDNKIEELGLDYIDEPAISGIDPSIFSLELAYKLKSKIPEGYVIKNIEEAHKNPKMIQNWIDNLENLHKESSSNHLDYSNKMPDLESLMQVNFFLFHL